MSSERVAFPFRPWVRRSCLKALFWGMGIVAVLAGVAWMLQAPGAVPLRRAFGVLILYGVLFSLTLLKVWWTAGKPAVWLGRNFLSYQPLHTFGVRKIPYGRVLSCAPRRSTESLRLVHEWKTDRAREFFLNLAVIDGRHEFLDQLGERLQAAGLQAVPGEKNSWRRPGWEDGP